MNLEEERKRLEQEKENLIKEKELIKLRSEVEQMKKQNKQPTIAGRFGDRFIDGAQRVGRGMLKVGENLSKADLNGSLIGKKKNGLQN